MSKKYDVCAIGNALVDYEIEVNDEFFTANEVEKGVMTLVEEDRQAVLLEKVAGKIKKKQGGGSAANSIFGLSQFGGKGFYTCKVASDEDGSFFIDELVGNGIDTNLDPKNLLDGTTGKCLVMVTPDAERTMNTYLGITSNLSKNELDEEAITNSNYVFLEGFLVSSPTGMIAMKEAKRIAEEKGTKVSLTFSDPAMVKYFKDQMHEVVGDGVDLLFCNEEEAMLFTDTDNLSAAKEILKKHAKEFVITLGSNGATVYDGSKFIDIKPFKVEAVDTTGGGDMFAGAFLYAINHGHSHEKAGILASAASSAVVGKYGPRLEKEQIGRVLEVISK
jgi:sugar/nucleoside kinase (ribokinase family)